MSQTVAFVLPLPVALALVLLLLVLLALSAVALSLRKPVQVRDPAGEAHDDGFRRGLLELDPVAELSPARRGAR